MSRETTVVVGNALAGMIAALEVANQGKHVMMINPGGPWGGYFAGLEIDGVMFDAGLVKFEVDGYLNQAKSAELSSYDPEKRNDVGRFLKRVHQWAESYTPLHQFDMPKMWLDEVVYDDVVLSNAYHSFAQLPFAKESIKELENNDASAGIHAREKAVGNAYDTLDYETASLANHGYYMHSKIISPYVRKAQNVSSKKLLARYHRVAWSPLYYPETLLDSFKGKAVPLKPTVFHYPKQGGIGGIVKQVKQQLENHPNVQMLNVKILGLKQLNNGWDLTLPDSTIHADKLVWTGAPSHLLQTTGHQPAQVDEIKSAIGLLFLRIKRDDIRNVTTLMHVLDMNKAAYRITNQTACADNRQEDMNIVVEFNQEFFNELYGKQSDEGMVEKLVSELAAMKMVVAGAKPLIAKIVRIPGGFLVPNAAARDAWEADHQQMVKNYPGITRMAMSSGFFATSLNDQVVQGLHYAQQEAKTLNEKASNEELAVAD